MRDGRLAGAELASFARHTASARRARARYARSRRWPKRCARHPAPGRARTSYTACASGHGSSPAFDAGVWSRPFAAPGRWLRMLRPAAAVVMLAAAFLFWRARSAPNTDAAPSMLVQAAAGTTWSRRTEGARETMSLERGELVIHVDHGAARPG